MSPFVLWSNKLYLALCLMNFISSIFGLLVSLSLISRFSSHIKGILLNAVKYPNKPLYIPCVPCVQRLYVIT
jgi:hypothetical protein